MSDLLGHSITYRPPRIQRRQRVTYGPMRQTGAPCS